MNLLTCIYFGWSCIALAFALFAYYLSRRVWLAAYARWRFPQIAA